ncbi:amidase [Fontisubflavum oceani]|uniref:amidase n=1 Tax=Fontisubflavum oceani TaxID=2978973 RepID=UPI0025B335D7|nr:amidase [Fontisubflavum oceani]WJY21105.1 amidase [Fontisubflavum oceani]
MSDLLRLDAVELSRRMAAREVSAVELMRATLDRIAAVNGPVKAIVSLKDREALMGEARLADAMPRSGWLHGIPMAVKDLVAVKGVRSTFGSPLFADHVPEVDEALVMRLRNVGAIIIGKTNVPEFGLGSHSYNPVFGVTRNPYDLTLSAGGSSGGAGAALASGMVALADGSDMMGSLRNPAAWNSVYGFRPTAGLMPGEPGDAVFTNRLSTRGPMARSVADISALLETLTDGVFQPGAGPETPRIGWLADWGGAYPMEAGILPLAEAALAVMADLGWQVEPIAPPFEAPALWRSWTDLRSFSVALEHGADWRDPAKRALLKPEVVWEIERGFASTGDQIEQAAAIRLDWLAALDDVFSRIDALVLPSAQCWPFPAEWHWPKEIAGVAMDTYHRWMEVVVPVSLAGLPCLNLPAGFGANGLPGGLQLIGARGADAALLAMGEHYHRATDWPARHPPDL